MLAAVGRVDEGRQGKAGGGSVAAPAAALGSGAFPAFSWPQDHERVGDAEAGVSVWDRSHLVWSNAWCGQDDGS